MAANKKNICIEHGLRQGGCQYTLLFFVNLNDLLNKLELISFGACIYEIVLGNPAFADDFAILALFPLFLQFLLDIIQKYILAWSLQIGFDKSSVIIVILKKTQNQETKHKFKLGVSHLKYNSVKE